MRLNCNYEEEKQRVECGKKEETLEKCIHCFSAFWLRSSVERCIHYTDGWVSFSKCPLQTSDNPWWFTKCPQAKLQFQAKAITLFYSYTLSKFERLS